MRGWAAPSPFLRGKLQRLTAERVLVNGNGLFADRRIDGRLSMRSAALRIETRGVVDLAGAGYRDVAIAAELLRPPALFRNMTGRQVRMTALLDGGFGRADFRLSPDRAAHRLRPDRIRGRAGERARPAVAVRRSRCRCWSPRGG